MCSLPTCNDGIPDTSGSTVNSKIIPTLQHKALDIGCLLLSTDNDCVAPLATLSCVACLG